MFGSTVQKCRNCGREITGYVDVCPGCGVHKPVPVPITYYMVGIMLVGLIMYFLADFGAVIEFIEGFGREE